jgi:hypothetical protein
MTFKPATERQLNENFKKYEGGASEGRTLLLNSRNTPA